MGQEIVFIIMHTTLLLIHFLYLLFSLYSFQLTFHVKQLVNILIFKRRGYCCFKFVCRQILNTILLTVHYSVKLLTLVLNPLAYHHVKRVATVDLYLLKIIEQSAYCEIGRPRERCHAVAITKLSRLGVGYALTVAWTDDTNINTLVVDKEGQTVEELLLILVKSLSQRLEIRQVETVNNRSIHSLVYSFLVSFRNYLVYNKAHSSTIRNESSKALCKHTYCS